MLYLNGPNVATVDASVKYLISPLPFSALRYGSCTKSRTEKDSNCEFGRRPVSACTNWKNISPIVSVFGGGVAGAVEAACTASDKSREMQF